MALRQVLKFKPKALPDSTEWEMFTAIDFVVFGLFLLLSILVGLYHGIRASFQKDHSKTSEYLTGGRKLPIFPVCLSLLTTFIRLVNCFWKLHYWCNILDFRYSGIALLAGPSEIYLRGYAMGLSTLTGVLGFLFIAIFFIPMFYKLKVMLAPYLFLRGGCDFCIWAM